MFKDIFDFESWAPRSSRAWRLGQEPTPRGGQPAEASITDNDVDVLNQRLAETRQRDGGGAISSVDVEEELQCPEGPSFLQSTDEELASALSARISEVATSSAGSVDEVLENDAPRLTGAELSDLIYAKYGKRHDVSFVRRDIPGKTLVCLNIYHAHIGQRSFPMTPEAYAEKLDGVVLYLEAWGMTGRVVAFLKEPVAPRRGLPSRPIVGNAVSIQLDLTRDQVTEWFGR